MNLDYDRDPDKYYEQRLDSGRLPNNDALKQIVLERLVEQFDDDTTYTKSEVDEVLAADFEDHVLVRRELVNFGYLSYDNTANTYDIRKRELTEDDYRQNTRLERHARDLGLLE
jgi:hypothetical protein